MQCGREDLTVSELCRGRGEGAAAYREAQRKEQERRVSTGWAKAVMDRDYTEADFRQG